MLWYIVVDTEHDALIVSGYSQGLAALRVMQTSLPHCFWMVARLRLQHLLDW